MWADWREGKSSAASCPASPCPTLPVPHPGEPGIFRPPAEEGAQGNHVFHGLGWICWGQSGVHFGEVLCGGASHGVWRCRDWRHGGDSHPGSAKRKGVGEGARRGWLAFSAPARKGSPTISDSAGLGSRALVPTHALCPQGLILWTLAQVNVNLAGRWRGGRVEQRAEKYLPIHPSSNHDVWPRT